MQEITENIAVCAPADADPAVVVQRRAALSALFIALFIVAAIFLKFNLYFQFPINSDEFFYLSFVHTYERGELTTPIQSLHVHFFSWLKGVSDNEVTQVLRGREVMAFFFLGTCGFLFLLGRHLMGAVGAAFSVLCYLSLIFTIANGAAFRSDSPAACLSMCAVYLFVAKKDSRTCHVLVGALMAVAVLFTIKAGLYLILLGAAGIIRLAASTNRRADLKRMGWSLAVFFFVAVAGYALHRATLSHSQGGTTAGYIGHSFSTFVVFKRLFSGGRFLLTTLNNDTVFWLFIVLGFIIALVDLIGRRSTPRDRTAYVALMFLPLLSILFYRNTFPYYYAFMMPPVMLLCGYAFSRIISAIEPTDRRLAAVVTILLTAGAFAQSFALRYPAFIKTPMKTAAQHDLLFEIHKMFPQPVPYIDAPGMIASFPSAAFFMGSKGIEVYLKTGKPVLTQTLADKKPVFLLANVPYLDLRGERCPKAPGGLTLLEQDWKALKDYFIPHWGPIWVAGKQFDFWLEQGRQPFDIVAPGKYTVETESSVLIDGAVHSDGDVLELAAGFHTIEPDPAAQTATLRWGDHLYRPPVPPPPPPLYMCD